MAILDRVKERIETDLSDAELTALIAEATDEILSRFGPSSSGTITVLMEGERLFLIPNRPVASVTTVTEKDGDTDTVLAATDWRLWDRGRSVQRLSTGPNARTLWGPVVELVYTPEAEDTLRDEVTIKLVQLAVEFRGLKSEKVGDFSATYEDYSKARADVMNILMPRRGLAMA